MLYGNRKEATTGCAREAEMAIRFTEKAIEHAKAGNCRAAWNMADNAKMAARCAMNAHEELWVLTNGELTDDEFDAFEAAEVAQMKAVQAARAAANAVERVMEEARHG